MEHMQVHEGSALLRFFRNPAIGIMGSIASFVGVALAIYFFYTGRQTRDLRYVVSPAKAAVVKSGQSSRLRITLDGVPVERDVTAAQVAFWNEGRQSIRNTHMLRPLIIRTGANCQIIEARLRKVARDVSGVALDLSRAGEGEVVVDWTILERYDGGVLQLIYLGGPEAPVSATATVEDQGDVRFIDLSDDAEKRRVARGFAYTMASAVLVAAVAAFVACKLPRAGTYKKRFFRDLCLSALFMVILASLAMLFQFATTVAAPFGFD